LKIFQGAALPGARSALTNRCEVIMRINAVAGGVALVAAMALSGCGDRDITGSYDGPLLGTWSAVTVDGDSLPVVLQVVVEDVLCEITVSEIRFTFLQTARYTGRDTVTAQCSGLPPGDLSRNFDGTFRTVGSTLFLTEGRGAEQMATFEISGSLLTITTVEDGETSVTVLQRR
jgi:hypothetical protein